jgi:ADP-dependent NAD(P)H-hydrate dehydratase / NAD(P)H-hydrate epimerase
VIENTFIMKLFKSDQIKVIDETTIIEEPVSSIDLMERAAIQLLRWYLQKFDRSRRIFIFVGPGNNGGDGLALARLLETQRYEPVVFYIEFTEKTSADWKANLKRLKTETNVKIEYLSHAEQFPVIAEEDIIVDTIFGTGLTRPAEGLAGEVIKLINLTGATVISIDIPSGMFGEDNSLNNYEKIVKADFTLTFQFPKLAFMLAENAECLGEWVVLPIGLSPKAIRNESSPYTLLEKTDIAPLLKKRKKFDHKGVFGHGLLVSGSNGKMGAAVLGAEAALHSGLGLITCHIPSGGVTIVQSCIPEAMVNPDKNEYHISDIGTTDSFSAVGIGPGIGTGPDTQIAFHKFMNECKKPMVIDADGLNILSLNKEWFSFLREGMILTPHPKEFERLAGKSENGYSRLIRQKEFSRLHHVIIILKGAHTSITSPDGKVYFNNTGNPGMAKAGSGDTLTGIILSLLSQGYNPEEASVVGVYLHGLAGDIAAGEQSIESFIASDIIRSMAKAFNKLKEQ